MKIELSAKQLDVLISSVQRDAYQLETMAAELDREELQGVAAEYQRMARFRFDIAAALNEQRARKRKTT